MSLPARAGRQPAQGIATSPDKIITNHRVVLPPPTGPAFHEPPTQRPPGAHMAPSVAGECGRSNTRELGLPGPVSLLHRDENARSSLRFHFSVEPGPARRPPNHRATETQDKLAEHLRMCLIASRLANGTLAWQETTGRSAAGSQCSNVDAEINKTFLSPSPHGGRGLGVRGSKT